MERNASCGLPRAGARDEVRWLPWQPPVSLDPSPGEGCADCAYRKSNPAILMVQSAQDRAADDIPGPLNAAMDGGILVQ
jgi:hypothetical protein